MSQLLFQQICTALDHLHKQTAAGDETALVVWVIPGTLACAYRPLQHHPEFGRWRSLPPTARPWVVQWVEHIKHLGIQSILCLLPEALLVRYYVEGGLDLHPQGLLGYYAAQGLRVHHCPVGGRCLGLGDILPQLLTVFDALPKPILLHCGSARSYLPVVAAFLAEHRGESK